MNDLPEEDAREIYRILEKDSDIRSTASKELEEQYGFVYELALDKVTQNLLRTQLVRKIDVRRNVEELDESDLQKTFHSLENANRYAQKKYNGVKIIEDEKYVESIIRSQGHIKQSRLEEELKNPYF